MKEWTTPKILSSGNKGDSRTAPGFARAAFFLMIFPMVAMGCAYSIPAGDAALAGLLASLRITTNDAVVSVTNMRDGMKARSGFLVGTATGTSIAAVEVSLDSGTYTEATGTDNWRWQLPTGSTGLRIGQSYTLSIRARDTDGAYSSILTLTIRKDLNRDVNGDGYPDVLVGAQNFNSGQGRAYLFYGGASGIDTKSGSAADAIFTGESSSRLGGALALADINGDGYADAIVGGGGFSGNTGRVYVFHSTGQTGIASTDAASAKNIITGSAAGEFLGAALAPGDLDQDGYTDIAAGAFGGNGAYFLFRSAGSGGIPTQTSATADASLTHTAAGELYGFGLALGDINGDGFPDLLGSASIASAGDGAVYIFLSSGGMLTSRTTSAADATITGEASSTLGTPLLIDDLNGDNFQDAVMGANGFSSNTGRTYIFHSAGASGIASGAATSADTILTGETGSQFSGSLSSGDVNGDGTADLLVSAQGFNGAGTSRGRSYVFYSVGSMASGGALTQAGSFFTAAVNNQRLGTAGAIYDLNADGFDDVLTAGGHTGSGTDRLFYFQSPGASMIASQDLGAGGTANATLTGENGTDAFAESMAR